MSLLDLSLSVDESQNLSNVKTSYDRREVHISSNGTSYTGVIYDFTFGSMAGTYIDFPGHIAETDDGNDSSTYPIESLYRLDCVAAKLDRQSGSGGVGADELRSSIRGEINGCRALVVNALGGKRFDEIADRSVWLEKSAVDWICESGVSLLVSDIYESEALHGVFYDLFASRVSTVCYPVNLHLLPSSPFKISAFPLRMRGVTQLPCRVIAEI